MPSQTEGQTPIQMDGTLLLVGAGNMGGAMLRGWLANGPAKLLAGPSRRPAPRRGPLHWPCIFAQELI